MTITRNNFCSLEAKYRRTNPLFPFVFYYMLNSMKEPVPAVPFSRISREPSFRQPFCNLSDKSSIFFFSVDETVILLVVLSLLSALEMSTSYGLLEFSSDDGIDELNKLGACRHGTGPDPANWLQFLTDKSLSLSGTGEWKNKDGCHAGFDV